MRTAHFALLLLALAPAMTAGAAPSPSAVLVSDDAKQPSVAIAADGNVYVAYLHGGNVVVSVSKDRGKSFDEPRIAIDAKGHARGGRQRGPRIGVSGSGLVVVTAPITYDEAELARKYPTAELFVATSADGGAKWSAPLRVNEIEKQAPEALHAMSVAADGTVHVAWLDLRARTDRGQDLWYARVADGKVGANVKVADEVCECCAPGLALDGAGNPCIAWRQGGDKDSRELFVAGSTDGGRTFGKPSRFNRGDSKERTCPMSAPAVAVTSDGKQFAVAWKDVREGSPRVWWSTSLQLKFGTEEPVADELKTERDHPSIAADERGNFWLAWEDGAGAERRIRARLCSSKGTVRDVTDAAEGAPAFPVTACGAGLVVVGWETSGKPGGERVFLRVIENAAR